MTIPSLRVEQHAQILGYSILGYGVANIIELIVPVFQAMKLSSIVSEQLSELGEYSKKSFEFESYLWPKIIFGIGLFALCIVTSIVIRTKDVNPKVLGLGLAVLIFGLFPLGTMLSVYILIFLFVIDDGDYNAGSAVNTVNLNG